MTLCIPRAGDPLPDCGHCRETLRYCLHRIAQQRVFRSATGVGTIYYGHDRLVMAESPAHAEIKDAIVDAGHAQEDGYTVVRTVLCECDHPIRLVPLVLTASGKALLQRLNEQWRQRMDQLVNSEAW